MEVKLRMISCSFHVNETKKTVTAVVKTESKVKYWKQENTTVGIAKCDAFDTFDMEIGKKIAKARAEKEAYICHMKFLRSHLERLKHETNVVLEKYNKTKRLINCQKEYICSFKQ